MRGHQASFCTDAAAGWGKLATSQALLLADTGGLRGGGGGGGGGAGTGQRAENKLFTTL